ncbi:aldehyde dehydrogenase family protein [Streptomyces sp. PGLac3x]
MGSGQAREEAGGVAALHSGQLGGVIVTYAEADAATGRTAIDAAVRAFTEDSWRLDPMARATALSHLADAYTARMDEVVDTLCQENGKLRREAGFEAHFIPRAFRFAAGAKALVRGRPSTLPELAGGAFYHPTLLAVSDSSLPSPPIQEESFGPVQTVQVFDTEDEAVALATDTDYGLSACVWTRDADRPVRLARRLDAGLISVNSRANLTVEFEEGGFESSGVGRLGGVASVEDFLEHKQLTQDFGSWG